MMSVAGGPPKSSQEIIDAFWKVNLGSIKPPSRPFSVLPDNVYAKLERQRAPKPVATGVSVAASYAEAVKDCETKVARIVAECKRNNIKYSDPHFDLDDQEQCLEPLAPGRKVDRSDDDDGGNSSASSVVLVQSVYNRPACAKRVGAIFEKPQFFIGGPPDVRDTRQGSEGDCWFISSIGSLCVDEEDRHLVERLCPPKARHEKVGVYGFVFYRDGEWISEVVDDKLYLKCPDYDDCDDDRKSAWDRSHARVDANTKRMGFRKAFQTGSDALFYGSCSDQNETWVPLMEKAFAKAHGTYTAIAGGFPGEGLEDLTGGITTKITSADILDTDEFWTDGLLKVNKNFLFGAGTKSWAAQEAYGEKGRQGIQDGHAYSVLKAVEYQENRLLLIKNPWGDSEWNGPWSDGAKEWNPDALRDLEYEFGDDGIFWMLYEDFLQRFDEIWRTRLFSKDWKVTQEWTTIQVPWTGDYNPTKYQFTISEDTKAVIVLSKLDDRYFEGLEGQYAFDFSFRLHATGEEAHLIRGYESGNRSAVAELDLEAGTYDVLMQVAGKYYRSRPKIEDIVRDNWLKRREKLIRVGLSYDLAQAKGQIEQPEEEDEEEEEEASKQGGANGETAVTPPTPPPESANQGEEASDAGREGLGAGYGDEPAPAPAPVPASAPAQSEAGSDEDEDEDGPGPEAWNATLVIGLRVFCESSSAEIRIITPESEAAMQEAMEKMKLDIDDPEKDLAEHHEGGQETGDDQWEDEEE